MIIRQNWPSCLQFPFKSMEIFRQILKNLILIKIMVLIITLNLLLNIIDIMDNYL